MRQRGTGCGDSLLDGDVVADTSELALDADTVAVVRRRLDRVEWCAALGVGVVVVVGEVACAVVVPARGRVDQPAAVGGPDALGDGVLGVGWCPDLAPAFVVDHLEIRSAAAALCDCRGTTYPGHNGGVAQVLVNHDVELALKLCLLVAIGERHTRRHGGHVLDDHHTEGVGGVVKQVWLDFDLVDLSCQHLPSVFKHQAHNAHRDNLITHVLANCIEAELLQGLQVKDQSLIVGRKVDSVRPETLVQGRPLEDPLAVEQRPLDTINNTTANAAESGVARYSVIAQCDGQVVQGRRVRAPRIDTIDGDFKGAARGAGARAKDAAVLVQDRDFDLLARAVAGGVHIDGGGAVRGGLDIQLGDVRGRGALEPHRLPDAAAGPVEDVLWVLGLLADWNHIAGQVCWVKDKHLSAQFHRGQLFFFFFFFVVLLVTPSTRDGVAIPL